MQEHERTRVRQLDLLLRTAEERVPQLPAGAIAQVRQLLQKLLLEIIDAKRGGLGDVDE